MSIFRALLKIAKKHLTSTVLYFGIFFILCVFLGAQEGRVNDFSNRRLSLAVFDKDRSEASEKLIAYLKTLHDVNTDMKDDEEALMDSLYYREIDYVLYIQNGYENTGKLNNIKRNGTYDGIYVDTQIAQYGQTMNAMLAAGYSLDDAYEITMEALNEEDYVTMQEEKDEKGVIYYFYLYIPYVLTMMLCMTISPIIIEFRKKELSDRLNVSPVSAKRKNLWMIAGMVLISLAAWLTFLLASLLLYGNTAIKNGGVLLVGNSFSYMIVAASLASLIGSFQISTETLNIISNIVGLGISFLGGIFVPIEFFGKEMLAVAKFMPTYWYVAAQDKIYKGGAAKEIFLCMGIELLFAAAFFSAGMLIAKQIKIRRTA